MPAPATNAARSCRRSASSPDAARRSRGRAYRLADGQSLSLVGRSADGRRVSLALERSTAIAASRTHVAVTVSIPRALLDRHGLERAGIAVGDNVSAIPLASAEDRRPQTEGEIAAATGHGRRLATAIVDRDTDRMPAVRLMTRMSNAQPGGDRDAVWASMVDDAEARGVSAAAIGFARFNYELCGFKTANRIVASFRECLRGLSDDSMEFLNADLERRWARGANPHFSPLSRPASRPGVRPARSGPKSVAGTTVEARDAAGGRPGATLRAALSGRQVCVEALARCPRIAPLGASPALSAGQRRAGHDSGFRARNAG